MTREMKYSGVEWIGDIPSEWLIRKIKNVCNIYTGNSIKDNEKNNFTDSTNAIPYIATKDIDVSSSKINYDNGMYVKNDDENFKVASKHSTLMCIEGGSAGKKIAYLNQDVCFVNKLCCFNAKTMDNKFLHFYLKSPSFNSEFNLHISGLIGGVSQGELKEFSIAIPPLPEQKKIANFLDRKIAEIDKIIAETKSSIENYKEYKQSVITEAVTKGLDKNVPMKDSGIEWIGDIPVGWNVNMLSQIFYQHKYKNKDNEENNLLSLSYGNIKRKNINVTEGLLPESFENYNIIDVNDIVLRLTDLQNDHKSLRVGYVEERGIITSAYVTIRSKRNINTKYFYYYLHTFDVHKGFYGMGCGVRQGLNFDELRKLKILYPPIDKQQQIIKYLDNICMKIDTTINKKEQLISNLEEYKKSLIYEYVTGKRTVE